MKRLRLQLVYRTSSVKSLTPRTLHLDRMSGVNWPLHPRGSRLPESQIMYFQIRLIDSSLGVYYSRTTLIILSQDYRVYALHRNLCTCNPATAAIFNWCFCHQGVICPANTTCQPSSIPILLGDNGNIRRVYPTSCIRKYLYLQKVENVFLNCLQGRWVGKGNSQAWYFPERKYDLLNYLHRKYRRIPVLSFWYWTLYQIP